MYKLRQVVAKGRSFVKNRPLSVRYGVDGVLVFGAFGIVVNNNNLFAQRLGAGDFHLSMLQFLPQIIMLFLLIPAGLFTDSLVNKRRMLSAVLVAAGFFLAAAGSSAFIPVYTVYFFLGFLALANVCNGLFNLSWQSFFPEVVAEDDEPGAGEVRTETRNTVLTFRARMTMLVNLVAPLTVGAVLTSIPSHEGKIAAHQVFYVIAAVLLFSNALHFRSFKASRPAAPKRVSFSEIKKAGRRLAGNRPFILFTLLILFFHMTWQADWTLYFIGQANYLNMNEFMITLAPVTATLAQLLTLKFWSRNNARHGVEKPLAYGMFGLALCPIAIIVGVSLPPGVGPWVFLCIHFIGHLSFASLALNLFQCLLKVVDEEYRSFSISVYICIITLSNAIMPVAGVALYRALGGNRQGIIYTFAILFVLRVLAGVLWLLRLKFAPASKATDAPSQA